MRASIITAAVTVALAVPAMAQPLLPPAPNASPAAPAPQGVPFPSMLQGQAGKTAVPLASDKMGLDQQGSAASMQRLDNQVDTRLNNLRLGSGTMDPPDVSGYHSELAQMGAEQREIRLLQIKQQRADLAMKLWSTLYDPRREEEARTVQAAAPAADAAREAEKKKQAEDAAKAATPDIPFPKVVSMGGSGSSLKAILLVPYVGEVNATPGTVLPGGRRVTRVTADGVFISDPKLGTLPLGYGDTVALTPPAPAAAIGPAPSPLGMARAPMPPTMQPALPMQPAAR